MKGAPLAAWTLRALLLALLMHLPVRANGQGGRPVVAILMDSAGTELTDFMIPHAVLVESGVARVVSVAPQARQMSLWPGTFTVTPERTLAAFDAEHPMGANFVIVPALREHDSPLIAAWLRAQAAHGAVVMSICEGARVVAHAGLFDGRNATTHWNALDELGAAYPTVHWTRNRRWVDEGTVISTTGVSAALPASVHLVERIGGHEAAVAVARRLGIAQWDQAHETRAFYTTKGMYVKAAWNSVAWWRHDEVGIRVADGVDEIALALTVDAVSRSVRGRAVTWSDNGGPVTTRQGLRIPIDRARSAMRGNAREITLEPPSTTPAGALDRAIAQLTAWYGPDVAALVEVGMEYRRALPTRP